MWYDLWDVTYRDVVILNGQNESVDVYNLTANDLRVAANYATMRDKLIDAAMTEQKPWQNHRDRFDINDDGFVVPRDVLIMINDINDNGPRDLLPPTTATLAAPYWDCSGDNFFSPLDILQVINFIEESNAEGEAPHELALQPVTVAIAAPTLVLRTSVEAASLDTQAVGVSLEVTIEPTPLGVAARVETLADDRSRSLEPAVDDFWADYWPSL
ncbi:MAG: hypothetical protein HYV60_14870 [Planctomycetia bacterium]|nr:hypothetical protein [Planctomycetia bacterium]